MAAGNQVVLTFGADTKQAEEGFARVGSASEGMSKKVGDSSERIKESGKEAGEGFEKVGGSADNAERNLIGVHDVIDGTATIMKGPGKQGIVAYIQGWADLAGGIAPIFEWLAKTKVATLAQAAAEGIASAASKVWAGAQWLLNAAMDANPIGIVVVAVAALAAAFVIAWNKSETFRKIVIGAWSGVKTAAEVAWNFLKKIPGWLGDAFKSIGNAILAPFRWAFNSVADAWNNTIGRLNWTVPSWVPGIGGDSIGVPKLPHFHTGGKVPGPAGSEMLAVLQAGETVIPAGGSGGGEMAHVSVVINGDVLVEAVSQIVRRRGGNVQLALGGRNA